MRKKAIIEKEKLRKKALIEERKKKLYADGLKRAENDDDQNDVALVCYYYIIDVLILSDRSI